MELTAVGHKCDDTRQEFVLLSDVFGVSMLVETINGGTEGTEKHRIRPLPPDGSHRLASWATPSTWSAPATVRDHRKLREADGYLAVGGGSTIGLGKALALQFGAPVVAVPTTYAGSEMTPIWGLTENAQKRTGQDRAVLPRSVVYDPDLTLTLPVSVSATSGLNALAHAVEALYAPDGSPVIAAMAEQGIRDLATALPAIVADPHDRSARAVALQGAWLCGACLGATTMGLHHKLCHALGGTLDLPHAETHAVPHVAAFNLQAAPEAAAALGRALQTNDPAAALALLADTLGVPRRLSELGVTADQLPQIIDTVLANPYSNPRPVGRTDLEHLLTAAL